MGALELLGDLESPPPRDVEDERGEAVPEVESFFLEDLFESLALDNCSCWILVSRSITYGRGAGRELSMTEQVKRRVNIPSFA